MKLAKLKIAKTGSLLALGALSANVMAQSVGSITHIPYSESIPALGGMGLLVLSALLGVVSLRFLKQRNASNTTFLLTATLLGAVAAAGSGVKLISDANAISGVSLSEGSGGVVSIPEQGYNTVHNDTGRGQQISEIELIDECTLLEPEEMVLNGGTKDKDNGGSFVGSCSDDPGTIMAAGDYCEVLVVCDEVNGGD